MSGPFVPKGYRHTPPPALTRDPAEIDLPARMSPAQREGFLMACACLERWGRQISGAGITLGGPAEPLIPRSRMMAHSGRMVTGCAQALALTLGQTG